MGVADNTLLDLIGKVRSWIYWGTSDLTSISGEVKMTDGGQTMCCQCEIRVSESCLGYHCQKCSRLFCERCVQGYGYGSFVVVESKSGTQAGLHLRSCRFCGNLDVKQKIGGKFSHKIHPSDSPRQSPEPPSPNCIRYVTISVISIYQDLIKIFYLKFCFFIGVTKMKQGILQRTCSARIALILQM